MTLHITLLEPTTDDLALLSKIVNVKIRDSSFISTEATLTKTGKTLKYPLELSITPSVKGLSYNKLKTTDYLIYCIDLSVPINTTTLQETIEKITKLHPPTPIILIGTNVSHESNTSVQLANMTPLSDLMWRQKNIEHLLMITQFNINEGTNYFYNKAQQKHWDHAVGLLNQTLTKHNLPTATLENLQTPLATLKQRLDDDTTEDTATLFYDFLKESRAVLEHDAPTYPIPSLMDALTTFALHLIWNTFLATLIGFNIAFMLGIWAGPGALIIGALSTNILTTAAMVGTIDASFRVGRLFLPVLSASWDIDNFVFSLKHNIINFG